MKNILKFIFFLPASHKQINIFYPSQNNFEKNFPNIPTITTSRRIIIVIRYFYNRLQLFSHIFSINAFLLPLKKILKSHTENLLKGRFLSHTKCSHKTTQKIFDTTHHLCTYVVLHTKAEGSESDANELREMEGA